MQSFDRNITGIGVLADPVRRKLYRYVCSQDQPVTRDQAAHAVGVARHKAKFHLDRLEAAGLLDADYVRVDRTRRAWCWTSVEALQPGERRVRRSSSGRDYELAGHIMADAISDSARNGTPIFDALNKAAAAYGQPSPPAQLITRPSPTLHSTSLSASSPNMPTSLAVSIAASSWRTVRSTPSLSITPSWSVG